MVTPHTTSTNPLTSTGAPLISAAGLTEVEAQASQPPLMEQAVTPSAPPAEGLSDESAPPRSTEHGITVTVHEELRPLTPRKLQRLEAFINTRDQARGSNVLIVIKGHPDPDSIGSAVAQQHCFKRFDIQSTTLYFDEISHPENRALVKVIEMDLTLYHEEFNFGAFDYLAFIDSQTTDIPQALGQTLPPILTFVDHHKDTGKVEAAFVDIRETYGSTSAIYAEYLEYYPDFSLQKSSSSDAHLATALMHGIRTDTDNLTLGSSHDFYAAGYLRNFIDRDLLRMVSKQSVSARTMEIIKQGLNNKVIKGTFLLAGVGFVREEDRDGIAQTADFLLRHEGVETAVVFGIVNNNIVDGSLRTSSATVDPDRWLKELFGQDDHGKAYGGGRRNKGGFRIPLGLLAFSPDRRALWKLGEQTIHDLIFEKIGGKEDDAKES
jgi:nanoRNase/pAp phosphatase (c-di-AMP/oligoRNAs hydrolase)